MQTPLLKKGVCVYTFKPASGVEVQRAGPCWVTKD